MKFVGFLLPDGKGMETEITRCDTESILCDFLMELKRNIAFVPPYKVMSESEFTLEQIKANGKYNVVFA